MQSQYLDKSGLNKLKTRIQGILDQLLAHTRNNTVHITQAEREAWNSAAPTDLGDLAYKDSASGSFTPSGSVSQPSFSGTQATISMSGTPTGSVAAPTITESKTTVNSITDVGTLPALTFTVTGENLTIGWSAGTLPTKGSDTSVLTGASASAPAFTGSTLSLSTTYTPAGTVSQPSFSGSQGTVEVT